ncbi:MAG: energy transducer TonB [Oligoflexia bacterium]|nr:energy transducer TonB [Oligoflexia bacterium]
MAMNETAAFGICLALSATVHTFALFEFGGLGNRQPAIVDGNRVFVVDLLPEAEGRSTEPEGRVAAGAVLQGGANVEIKSDRETIKQQRPGTLALRRQISFAERIVPSAAADPARSGAPGTEGQSAGGALGAALTYAPKPPYPYAARLAGFEGKLSLEILVGTDGRVLSGQVIQSSGREDCDQSALDTVLASWHFSPAQKDNRAAQSRERVVIKYTLN